MAAQDAAEATDMVIEETNHITIMIFGQALLRRIDPQMDYPSGYFSDNTYEFAGREERRGIERRIIQNEAAQASTTTPSAAEATWSTTGMAGYQHVHLRPSLWQEASVAANTNTTQQPKTPQPTTTQQPTTAAPAMAAGATEQTAAAEQPALGNPLANQNLNLN